MEEFVVYPNAALPAVKTSTNVPICKALSTTAVAESLKSNPRPISQAPNRQIATESSSGLPGDGLAVEEPFFNSCF
ncbi:hypothetical protein PPACK8108_LOCUS3051 [Phakopsora pachyrhizi]|uniref:Uncharacterized protein n=1 Tax=Phakopsora pachyrhizi TaxID=170000 RepID=A0AAV0AMX7_PHAPC|nr:hypothetical protein PPACK8108_LOCUS3051 [Phakopsora pachyrhizi]